MREYANFGRMLEDMRDDIRGLDTKVDKLNEDRVSRADFEALRREIVEHERQIEVRYYSRGEIDGMRRQSEDDRARLRADINNLQSSTSTQGERMMLRIGSLIAIAIGLLEMLRYIKLP